MSVKKLAIMAVSVSALALAACQTTSIQEQPATNVNLAPAERTMLQTGEVSKFKRLRDGEQLVTTVTLEKPGIYKWEVSNGCSGTALASDRFAPTLSWNKCGNNPRWNTGTATIKNKTGELWPLKVGNKVSYSLTTKSYTGRTNDNVRNCEVTGVVNVTAAGKPYDTFKVVCNDRFNRRTFYYAPSVESVVLEENYQKSRNATDVTEFLERL